MSYEIIEKLKKEISGYKDETQFEHVGVVTEVGDGIAKISGLSKALSQELLNIESSGGTIASIAFNLEESFIGAVILGDAQKVRVGDRVHQTGKVVSIRVGEELLGRVVDPLGNQLDNKGVIFVDKSKGKDYPLERSAPSVVARESVNTPLHTGIKAIDAMIPIGRGQRELIIGDRQTGKTAIVLDTIINQKGKNLLCIYVAIGQKSAKVARLIDELNRRGAMEYTIVVVASASDPASLQYIAPYAGTAMAEYFMDQGQDVLMVYDDLSKQAAAYRQISLILRRPPGREAYPGDIFYAHSRLLERACRRSKEYGGGSITALPIIETQAGDVSAYIPTNVISITDGQIYLEPDLFYQGTRPAINVGLSVSRVGSSAQLKPMKKVAGKIRLDLAQYRELAAFAQFGSDLDEATKKQLERGRRANEVMKQPQYEPRPVADQVTIIYAVINGFMDDIEVADILQLEKDLIHFANINAKKLMEKISAGTWEEATEKALRQVIEDFKESRQKSE